MNYLHGLSVGTTGGNTRWYDPHRRILEAGKSVQAVDIRPDEVLPLLDTVRGKGRYIIADIKTEMECEKINRLIEPYR